MTPAEKKQAIGDALDYWYLLDFLSQGDQPEEKKDPPRPRKGMLDDCFVPEERDDQELRRLLKKRESVRIVSQTAKTGRSQRFIVTWAPFHAKRS